MLLCVLILSCVLCAARGHAPPPGYYCYLQCLNKCLATPPEVKVDDLLEFCKTEVCWPMNTDKSNCDSDHRSCFVGSCKPSDVGWIIDGNAKPMRPPKLTSKRRPESANLWRLEWNAVAGALFYAVYRWKEGDNSSTFYHQEVRDTWYLFPITECKQHFARVAAISTTGISAFSDVTEAYGFMNESEEVFMKLTMKGASLVPLPYFYDPISLSAVPSNSVPEPIEPTTLILTIGYQLDSRGWIDQDVQDLIDYAFLPVSCPPSDSSLDLTSLKPKTVNGRDEFVLNLPGSIAERKCKFLFSVKSISAPCGRTARVVHALPGNNDGTYGLWSTLDCAKIENAICQDEPRRVDAKILHQLAIDDPPRGQDPEEPAGSSRPTQIPPSTVRRFSDESVVQPLAVLLAVLLALVAALFFIIRCAVCKQRNQKQSSAMTM